MRPTRSTYLFALAVIPSLMVWTSEVFAQQKLGYPPGRGSYVRYCGSCHRRRWKRKRTQGCLVKPKAGRSDSACEKEWRQLSDRTGDQNP
jgi:hypothetical protein